MIPELPFPFEGVHRVSQGFGARPEFYARWNLKGHNGIDFALPIRTPVLAVDDGQVLKLEYDKAGYGIYVKVGHSWGATLYAHLSEHHVWLGAPVKAGQVLGLSGSTGVSSGPHLHFGLSPFSAERGNGYNGYVDPTGYLVRPGGARGEVAEFVAPVTAASAMDGMDTMGATAAPDGGPVTFDWYQGAALRTWRATADAKADLGYLALSLSEEAGELGGLVKKHWRHGHNLDLTKLKEEAGDVLWYLAVFCAAAGIDLGEVAIENERKLRERYPDGFSEERSRNRKGVPPRPEPQITWHTNI